jgi:hypothetical protein
MAARRGNSSPPAVAVPTRGTHLASWSADLHLHLDLVQCSGKQRRYDLLEGLHLAVKEFSNAERCVVIGPV